MLFLPEEHIEILTHNFSNDTEMIKMLDNNFTSQAIKDSNVSFTIKILGYTDFVFVNTQADTIEIVIKNDNNEIIFQENQILKDIQAGSCEELFEVTPVWLDTGYIKTCDRYTGEATITLTPRDGYVKIGKFSYGTPVAIGAVSANITYEYQDYLKLSEDESDYESIDRFEILSGTFWVEKHFTRFAKIKLQKVIKQKMIWIDPFNDKLFIYGMLENYKIRIEEEEEKMNLLTPIDISIRGIA